jgi:hypothetical protein
VREMVATQFAAHGLPGHEELGTMVEELIEPNPRKLKNFVNSACAQWRLLSGHAEAKTAEFASLFILFQYLRTQHRAVWRVLERQPWALCVFEKVLTSGTHIKADGIPKEFGADEQRLMDALFVLREPRADGTTEEMSKRHGHLPISEAVDLMLQRADRKRSDEQFVRYFRTLVINKEIREVPDALLRLPEPQ